MKKIVVTVLLLLGISLVCFIAWLGFRSGPSTPAFRPARSQPRIAPYRASYYEFLSPSPFEGGNMWVSVSGKSNEYHCFLYDIDRRTILGELLHAAPVFMSRDQSTLLCVQGGPRQRTLRDRIAALVERISQGKIHFQRPSDRTETFWAIDLKKNTATKLGTASSFGSPCRPSPGFRYGYVKPIGGPQQAGMLVFDLEKKTLMTVKQDGWPQGWWDDSSIVLKDSNQNFILYNVVTTNTSLLLGSARVADLLEQMAIPSDSSKANLFTIWNGEENDLYLTDTHKKWEAVESFLIKVERPGPRLKLLAPNFKFEWSDHLDSTGNYYLYSGREAGHESSGVFLRDLRNNTSRTLVPSDGGKYFSIPRFDRDGVIYVRSNMLWRIKLDRTNPTRLFPPPEAQLSAEGG